MWEEPLRLPGLGAQPRRNSARQTFRAFVLGQLLNVIVQEKR